MATLPRGLSSSIWPARFADNELGDWVPSDKAKQREAARIPSLEWMQEFDSHLSEIDSRLTPPPPAPKKSARDREDTRRRPVKPGTILVIRYRLPWPFSLLRRRERREHPLTTVRLRA